MGGTPSKPNPSTRMEVIGAGYPRTGTLSMAIAIEKLLQKPVVHGGSRTFGGEGCMANSSPCSAIILIDNSNSLLQEMGTIDTSQACWSTRTVPQTAPRSHGWICGVALTCHMSSLSQNWLSSTQRRKWCWSLEIQHVGGQAFR